MTQASQDRLNRFLFDNLPIRGELVHLSETYQRVLADHNYPPRVQQLLGELLVATSLLTATLKFEGDITIQLQGDGPLSLAVINGNHQQQMRGVARINGDIAADSTLPQMVGKGYIVITITPQKGERYQGIVALEHDSLAECLQDYFARSEQLPTYLMLHTGVEQQQAVAAGLLLQVLPSEENIQQAFEHVTTLAKTVQAKELLTLSADELLYRLYHQDEVRLLASQPVEFQCRCSRERCEEALLTLSSKEINQMLEEEAQISMHCDYCNQDYHFDKVDIENLRRHQVENKSS